MESVGSVLNYQLVVLSNGAVTVASLVVALVIFFTSIVVSRIVGRIVRRSLQTSDTRGRTVNVIERLSHYLILLVGIGVSLDTVGIDLSALFAAGAIFAIGIGFAMQSIAQNFVAGVILLVERSVSVGDVLVVEGRVVRVESMGIRSTIVRTQDDEQLIVPNATIVQSTVANYTLTDSLLRIHGRVGVTYDSDMKLVLETLAELGAQLPWRSQRKTPQARLTGFGDSSVDFDLLVWVEEPWDAPRYLSDLNQAIWWAFKAKDIVIAFPQLDVHFDAPVVERIGPRVVAQ